MLIDLHAHTGAISYCCKMDAENVIKTAKEHGFDGLAIANHYMNPYFTADTHRDFIERYIAEWKNCAELGKQYGLRIFKAVEVTMAHDPLLHMLIYGADEAFLRDNLFLCDLSLAELYALCERYGCALIQGHPFRGGETIQEVQYLHGLEVNCHPLYQNSYADTILQAAHEAHLAVTVGCDYHADTYRPDGGSVLPDDIATDRNLAEYLRTADTFALQIHEPLDGRLYRHTYQR